MAQNDVMTTALFVNADWSALVPAGSPDAAYGITPKDAKRRGLLPLDDGESLGEPEALMVSANLLPADEPEEAADEETDVKEADKPADKAAPKPANKSAKKPASK
jgi:hypothetical protein